MIHGWRSVHWELRDAPAEHYEPDVDQTISMRKRAEMLREKLEGYVSQMAAESSEIGCAETTDTLRMQAIGILIALRELQRHIPEIAN
ncbi:MAG: hypothetical protein KatS3mg111_2967 [Pirellulaceae bacterium]|nr:MAG: hypothetical protein KatS3mg111_2967 [Pirellulaceae bacterium]